MKVEDDQTYTCNFYKKLTQATQNTASTQVSEEEKKVENDEHHMVKKTSFMTEYSEDDHPQINLNQSIQIDEQKEKILGLLRQGTMKLYNEKSEFYEKNKNKYKNEIEQATQPVPNGSVESIRQRVKEQRDKFEDDFENEK